jgi:hypothetical protein
MKLRNPIIGAVASLALAGSMGVGVAHAGTSTSLSQVEIKMVVPSKVNTAGSFEMQVLGVGTFKSFDLYRKAANLSGSFVKIKSKDNGKSYIDTEQTSYGQTTFEMVAYSGLNDTGSKVTGYSNAFYPEAETIQSGAFYCYDSNGTGTDVTGSKWFGGVAFMVSGPDTVYCDTYYYTYNDGMIIGVGPTGASSVSVYANSAAAGTMSFHSSTANGFTEGYKHGKATASYFYYKFVNSGSGDMWFTGAVQAASNGA